jgi:hypothetical protein
MIYDVTVEVNGREVKHGQVTKIMAQRIFESYIEDGVDFTIKLMEYSCKHYWETDRSLTSITFQCSNCVATFDLTDADLNSYLRATE